MNSTKWTRVCSYASTYVYWNGIVGPFIFSPETFHIIPNDLFLYTYFFAHAAHLIESNNVSHIYSWWFPGWFGETLTTILVSWPYPDGRNSRKM